MGKREAEERLREAREEAEDDLREVILIIIRAHRNGGTIAADEVGELSEVASAYFDDDVFEREYYGDDGT